MKKYDLGIAAVLILIAICMIRASSGYGVAVDGTAMGAGQWPAMLAGLLILLSAVLAGEAAVGLLRERRAKQKTGEAPPFRFRSREMCRVYILIGILAAYWPGLVYLGFWITSALAIPAVTLLMGERRILRLVILTAAILLFVLLVFQLALGLKLPVGRLFQ